MFRRTKFLCRSRRAGLTLVEMVISLALLILLSLVTISSMIMHARMAKSNLTQQQISESCRRFVDAVQVIALDATLIRIDTGPAGPNTVLTLGKPDPDNLGQTIYRQYAYLDGDNNPETIADNRLVERDVNMPGSSEGKLVVDLCSPIPATPVFSRSTGAARPLYQINLRAGDRENPPSNADNAITGRGFQGYLIAASFSQL